MALIFFLWTPNWLFKEFSTPGNDDIEGEETDSVGSPCVLWGTSISYETSLMSPTVLVGSGLRILHSLLIYCVALNTPWSIPFNEKERFTLYFIYVWVILFGFCLRICKCPTCAVPWGQRIVSDPLGLESQMLVYCVGAGNQTQVLCKSSQCT